MSDRLPLDEARIRGAASGPADVMTIVVGFSGSGASVVALRWAAAEANRVHAQLRVVRSWTTEARAPYAPAVGSDEYSQRHARAVAGLVVAASSLARYLPSDKVTTAAIQGVPERVLVEQSAGADLLVLGCAAGLAGDRSIGPVIRACLSHAHCPVVVVGPGGPASRCQSGAATAHLDPDARDLALSGPRARTGPSDPNRRSR